jgi:hypothetical protein
MKRGWNRKQTRNHPILYRSRYTGSWQNKYGMIPYYWIGKPKDHFGITLVARTQPGNKLERRNTTMEDYDYGRSVR